MIDKSDDNAGSSSIPDREPMRVRYWTEKDSDLYTTAGEIRKAFEALSRDYTELGAAKKLKEEFDMDWQLAIEALEKLDLLSPEAVASLKEDHKGAVPRPWVGYPEGRTAETVDDPSDPRLKVNSDVGHHKPKLMLSSEIRHAWEDTEDCGMAELYVRLRAMARLHNMEEPLAEKALQQLGLLTHAQTEMLQRQREETKARERSQQGSGLGMAYGRGSWD